MASICCWLVAQVPQFVQNFRRRSAEGLNPWFLAQWLMGDTLNLLGCLMTGDQLPSETYTAIYFMCVDMVMIFQFIYYALLNRDALELITQDMRDPENGVCYVRLDGDPDEEGMHDERGARSRGATVGHNGGSGERHNNLSEGAATEAGALDRLGNRPSNRLISPTLLGVNDRCSQQETSSQPEENFSGAQSAVPLQTSISAARADQRAQTSPTPSFASRAGSNSAELPPRPGGRGRRRRRGRGGRGEAAGAAAATGVVAAAAVLGATSLACAGIWHVSGGGASITATTAAGSRGLSVWGGDHSGMGLESLGGNRFRSSRWVRTWAKDHEHWSGHTDDTWVQQWVIGERERSNGASLGNDIGEGNVQPKVCSESLNPAWEVLIGRTVGYASSMLYLGSRMSQIYQNYKRRSCEGLSMAMFATAATANSLYGIAIILRASTWRLLLNSVPWLLGSLGTVALDSTILLQSRWYGKDGDDSEDDGEEEEEQGSSDSREDYEREDSRVGRPLLCGN